MTDSKCIITSTSNKFYPSFMNMLGSMKVNYPNHPHIYVYDLGLSPFLKKEIEQIENVSVLSVLHFVPFWRSCYTWKTYILNNPLRDLNFYIDAGCQILKPLDTIFEKIEKNGYLLVSQGNEVFVRDVTPLEYISLLDIDEGKLQNEIITAGIVGFKKDSEITNVLKRLYDAGVSGLCLGFSEMDQWKNKGKNKNDFIRNCKLFRHDTTLLTVIVLKYLQHPIIESIENFSGSKTGNPEQLLWNLRMNYSKLEYIDIIHLSLKAKIFLNLFLKAKKINKWIKSKK